MAAGLLDINMLVGTACQDGGRRVPVVAGGDDEDVHGLVVEDTAKIADDARLVSRDLGDGAGAAFGPPLIDVANIGDLDTGLLLESVCQAGAAAAGTHDADQKLLARRLIVLGSSCGDGEGRGSAGGTGGEKAAPMCSTISTSRESMAGAMSASPLRKRTSAKFGEPSKRATRSRAWMP